MALPTRLILASLIRGGMTNKATEINMIDPEIGLVKNVLHSPWLIVIA